MASKGSKRSGESLPSTKPIPTHLLYLPPIPDDHRPTAARPLSCFQSHALSASSTISPSPQLIFIFFNPPPFITTNRQLRDPSLFDHHSLHFHHSIPYLPFLTSLLSPKKDSPLTKRRKKGKKEGSNTTKPSPTKQNLDLPQLHIEATQ